VIYSQRSQVPTGRQAQSAIPQQKGERQKHGSGQSHLSLFQPFLIPKTAKAGAFQKKVEIRKSPFSVIFTQYDERWGAQCSTGSATEFYTLFNNMMRGGFVVVFFSLKT
jgi:hypothetical protein